MTSTGISLPATLCGKTAEKHTTAAAIASDATFFEDQILGLPPLHFDYGENKGEEEELEKDEEEEVEVEVEEDIPSHHSHLTQQLSSGERLLSALYRPMASMQVELPEFPLEPPRWPSTDRLQMTPPLRRKIDEDGDPLDERDFDRDDESSSGSDTDEENMLDNKSLCNRTSTIRTSTTNGGFYSDVLEDLDDKSPRGGVKGSASVCRCSVLHLGAQEREVRDFEPVVPCGPTTA